MRILHHERKRGVDHFSIERLFAEIRQKLPPDLQVQSAPCPHPSRGVVGRWRNVLDAGRRDADVHHIVGDVHYLAFGLPRRRTVLTIHDCGALERLRGIKRAVLKYFWFTGPMRRAEVVTAISSATKDELRRWVGSLADKVEVVPDCVFDEFTPDQREFNTAAPVCLQVGTKWNKNVERVAEALRGTPCRLEIVGALSASHRACLERSGIPFVELGRLTDKGLLEAYRRCDFVMFASLYEGFGLPILEAQATGRPVITSNFGAMAEAAGEGALLVDPRSVESIRSAVTALLGDSALRADLIMRGSKNVEMFRSGAVARRYAEIYARVARAADAIRWSPEHTPNFR